MKVLSMGWGVQTWTLAAMMALEEIPRADFIVHADTDHEREATYDFAREWTPWLGEHGLTVITVHGKRTDVVEHAGVPSVMIPAFTKDSVTAKHGQIRRQCTDDWKIRPIRAFIREELARRGIKQRPGVAQSLLGISMDEWSRMHDSDVLYVTNEYPLVDLRMRRVDCVLWLERNNLPVAPKSSCTFCPYRSVSSWKTLKREGGPDWKEAVAVDATIRRKRPKADLFVHPARRPLPEAISIPEDVGATQLEMPCDSGYCLT